MGWFVFVFAGWVADGFCECTVLGCVFEFLGMFVLSGQAANFTVGLFGRMFLVLDWRCVVFLWVCWCLVSGGWILDWFVDGFLHVSSLAVWCGFCSVGFVGGRYVI